ncbi:hypothetical protein FRC10_002428 [Ceratobasidium sp. 414]|nr:hypothetical protein FRC10_002428 [Ceratobasidium sp. 414]
MSQSSRTPSKPRISGKLSASGTIKCEDWLLRDELAGRLHNEVAFPEFCRAFLEREQVATTALGEAASRLHTSDAFRAHYKLFSNVLEASTSERKQIYPPLVDLMNLVIRDTRNNHATADAFPLMFTAHSSTLPIRGSTSDRKPDVVGIQSNEPTESSPVTAPDPHWSTVSVVCEYKFAPPTSRRNPSTPLASQSRAPLDSSHSHDSSLDVPPLSNTTSRPVYQADVQLARYMLEMRTAQHTRAAGYGIQFARDHASFWYSDADSTIPSEFIPIDSPSFVRAIMCLAHASGTGLGYLPDFIGADGELSTDVRGARLILDGTTYTIHDVISHARAMHGRCTCILEARDDSDHRYAIKLSWQVTTHISEVKLIQLAHERGVTGITDVIFSADLRNLSDGRRSRLPPEVQSAVRLEDRCLRVLVLPLYLPLYKVPDPKTFMQACISLLQAIHDLYDKGSILHRDVSVNNLMVKREKQSEGVLIDLDLAHEEKPAGANEQGPTSLHRTGTLPFMALDLLQGQENHPHYHRHDLESFVYVLTWIAGRYENGEELDTNLFHEWCEGSWQSMTSKKEAFLSLALWTRFAPTRSFQCLAGFILKMRLCLHGAHMEVRKIAASQPHEQLCLSPARPTKRAHPSDETYANSSSGSKRRRPTSKRDVKDVTDPVLTYPKVIPGLNYEVLRVTLEDALAQVPEAALAS